MPTVTPSQLSRRRTRAFIALALALGALAGAAAPALAGSYNVLGTCAWQPYNQDGSRMAVYAGAAYGGCPMLVARNVVGHMSTAAGVAGGWRFAAPPGAALTGARLSASAVARKGWSAVVFAESASGLFLVRCPDGPDCPAGQRWFDWALFGMPPSVALRTQVRCAPNRGCPNDALDGRVELWQSVITISDATAPAVGAGGALAAGGWKGATQPVVVDGSDNVGIKETRVLIDGVLVQRAPRACNYALGVPCPNGPDTLSVPLRGVTDGPHAVTVQAIDSADNASASSWTALVDNTPPVAAQALTLDGGPGWRASNRWSLSWTNPRQAFAPIAGARYTLCPPEADSANPAEAAKAKKACVSGSRTSTELAQISDLSLPDPGRRVLRLWLVDAAGNADPDSAVRIEGLGYDPTPPTVAGFAAQDPSDPATSRVKASDDVSGIAAGEILVRRHGQDAWRPLPTRVTGGGVSAFIDDEALPRGVYDLRATVTDRAGLQQSTDRTTTNERATLKLPIRIASTLQAGRYAGRRCRRSSGTTRCQDRLQANPSVRIGRATRLRGRLTVAGKPVANQSLRVWRKLTLADAQWRRVGAVTTSRTGRFGYRAGAGPARMIRFRYPGNAHVRGDNAAVDLRVRAGTTIHSSRQLAINGEYVTFSGKLAGGWRPLEGVLVEIQVHSRGRWRTFAQPRADARTGRWSYQHRFEAVVGNPRFRFRARVRRQPGYPYRTGHSRDIRVRVRGL